MKIFFDTNVYVAAALRRQTTDALLDATIAGNWRVYISDHVVEEIGTTLHERLDFSLRVARIAQERARRVSKLIDPPPSRHRVPDDPKDSPILAAALFCGADYLVTNDRHLLALHPYEGLAIISLADYCDLLRAHGLTK